MTRGCKEKKAKIVKRWAMDRNVSDMWVALLMDDNTLHIVNPRKNINCICPPVSTEPEPRKWRMVDGEADILDDGTLLLHTDDEFGRAVYYPVEEVTA